MTNKEKIEELQKYKQLILNLKQLILNSDIDLNKELNQANYSKPKVRVIK